MRRILSRAACVMCAICLMMSIFSGCSNTQKNTVTDVINNAVEVYVNGVLTDTVEARMGAFQGKQGDYIEFRFATPQCFNTIFINEKTATIRQYNIYAETDGKYKLVHTGKNVFQENIVIESIVATAFKLEIVNTAIGDDNFIIQGISAYDILEGV